MKSPCRPVQGGRIGLPLISACTLNLVRSPCGGFTHPWGSSNMKASYTLFSLALAAAGLQQARAETEPFTLETIEVTARKRSESLQDVPMAVSAVTAEQVAAAGIRDVADLTLVAPSLVVTSNSNPFNTSYRIRRIGNEGNIPDFEPDTGLFIDGAYRSRSGMGLGDLADIEQIVVLRGQQSTCDWRNVTARASRVTTEVAY